MRRTLIALACVLCPVPLLAAPAPAGQSAAAGAVSQAHLQAAAREYAQNLGQVIALVGANYVRPVREAELIEAALTGLYEAAGVPVPAGLKADIKKAEKDNAWSPLLAKARAGLGNPEALQGRGATLASCRAMMRALDPFCAVLTGEEVATTAGFDQNYGLGIDLVEKAGPGPVVIKAVIPGGPAQRAGLQAGDHITQVDGKPTKALSTEQALQLLNGGVPYGGDVINLPAPGMIPGVFGAASTPARLMVRSAGAREERTVTLLRDSFEPETVQGVSRAEDNSWDYWVDRKQRIAHVRVVALAHHTAEELDRVLTGLGNPRGLILDLRWCPGGWLDPSIDAAGLFLEDGVVATIKGRGGPDKVYQARDGGGHKFLTCPIVVLVNAETSGGGELIAAALQDHKRAVVAGQRSRGKASIQTQTTIQLIADGHLGGTLQLKLTNGTFLRPSGKALNRFADSRPSDDWGVRPDPGLECRVSADLGRQLKEWWRDQTLRPGASNKALPLDDPEADPQRQAALKVLRGLMAEKK
jgi:C-terminal processing protease CtpA/Prc